MSNIGGLVERARGDSAAIDIMIKNKKVYIPQDPQKTQEFRDFVRPHLGSVTVFGEKNLEIAQDLAENHRLTVVGHHINPLDTILTKIGLGQVGFGELADRFTYLARFQMPADPVFKPWIGVDHVLHIAKSSDIEQMEEAINLVEPEDKPVIEECLGLKKRINGIAFSLYLRQLSLPKHGRKRHILGVFPEAEYQLNGGIVRAPTEVSRIFSDKEGEYILPILVVGHERWGDVIEKQVLDCVVDVRVLAGKPFASSLVWKYSSDTVTPVDLVMASLVRLDPSYVSPKDAHFYTPLIELPFLS